MEPFLLAFLVCSATMSMCQVVSGHGFLIDPPQRSSMWKKKFNVPANYNHMELNCGGRNKQISNGGKCGTCGDPYGEVQNNDDDGIYDTHTIGKTYNQGEEITMTVTLTANHKGYFTFRLCNNANLKREDLQSCLNDNVLTVNKSSLDEPERFYVSAGTGNLSVTTTLPAGITCCRCVLQWDYRTGNNWGTEGGQSGLGFGQQEHFINCADIRINPCDESEVASNQDTTSSTSVETSATDVTTTPPSTTSKTTAGVISSTGCHAVGAWENDTDMDMWCRDNCPRGFCPASHCDCNDTDL